MLAPVTSILLLAIIPYCREILYDRMCPTTRKIVRMRPTITLKKPSPSPSTISERPAETAATSKLTGTMKKTTMRVA